MSSAVHSIKSFVALKTPPHTSVRKLRNVLSVVHQANLRTLSSQLPKMVFLFELGMLRMYLYMLRECMVQSKPCPLRSPSCAR
jgi:hypothetical protein